MFWVGSMAPRGCVQWSASPLDLLAADQGGTRWDLSKSTHLEDLAVKVADMLEPRSNFSVAILNGRLFVMGGCRQDNKSWDIVILMVKINLACRGQAGRSEVCNLVDVYCPASNKYVSVLTFDKMRR